MSDIQFNSNALCGGISTAVDPAAVGADYVLRRSAMWFEAGRLSGADASAVSSWASVTRSMILGQTSGTLQPILKTAANGINSQSVVRFDGVNDYMSAPFPDAITAGFTLFVVIRPLAGETTKGIVSLSSALSDTTPCVLVQRSPNGGGAPCVRFYLGNGAGYNWTIAHPNNTAKVYSLMWSGTTWTLEDGGVDQGSANVGSIAGNRTTLFIGNGYNGYSNTDIATLAIWTRALTTKERLDATTYLKAKYGL